MEIRMGFYGEGVYQIALILTTDQWKHTPMDRPYIKGGWLHVPKGTGTPPPFNPSIGTYRKVWSVNTSRVDPVDGLEEYPLFGEIVCLWEETDKELKVRIPVLPMKMTDPLRAARDLINRSLAADESLCLEVNGKAIRLVRTIKEEL